MQMISGRKLYNSLQKAVENRNRWLGHGGIANEVVWEERLKLAEILLSEIQNTIANTYEQCNLVTPGKRMELVKGLFNQEVKILMGNRTPFRTEIISSSIPMAKSHIYLIHEGENQPLQLLRFIRFFESPRKEQNACYFYNSIEKNGVRWISYHFSVESERIEPDPETEKALTLLE